MSQPTPSKLPPLAIKCTDSACGDNLHCFKQARSTAKKKAFKKGLCRMCGADLIDWPRVHGRDLSDVEHTFDQLRHELIRHHFWHVEFDTKALNHARRKGRVQLHLAARQRVLTSVSRCDNPREGRQTPFKENTLYYAQHATASCCRPCIQYWHDIPANRDLTEQEIDYLTNLVIRYVDERLPDLDDDSVYVPRDSGRP
jgi:hypothetical protein